MKGKGRGNEKEEHSKNLQSKEGFSVSSGKIFSVFMDFNRVSNKSSPNVYFIVGGTET